MQHAQLLASCNFFHLIKVIFAITIASKKNQSGYVLALGMFCLGSNYSIQISSMLFTLFCLKYIYKQHVEIDVLDRSVVYKMKGIK